jgi:hypothetical protein
MWTRVRMVQNDESGVALQRGADEEIIGKPRKVFFLPATARKAGVSS